jgi:hypothetical protein
MIDDTDVGLRGRHAETVEALPSMGRDTSKDLLDGVLIHGRSFRGGASRAWTRATPRPPRTPSARSAGVASSGVCYAIAPGGTEASCKPGGKASISAALKMFSSSRQSEPP